MVDGAVTHLRPGGRLDCSDGQVLHEWCVQGFGIAITMEATEEDLFNVVFAHPTMSEAMHEAALDVPATGAHLRLAGEEHTWWPEDSLWHESAAARAGGAASTARTIARRTR